MSNFVRYKELPPINLDFVPSFELIKDEIMLGHYTITFYNYQDWIFDNEDDARKTYDWLLASHTELINPKNIMACKKN